MSTLLDIEAADIRRVSGGGAAPYRFVIDRLKLARGDRVGVVGTSGSGKSTLLDFIALLIWPTALDRLTLQRPNGARVDVAELLLGRRQGAVAALRAETVGYVTQSGALLPYLTVRANAALAAELAGRADGARQRIERLAERLGIGRHLDRKPSRLSGGERQRAATLRMLASGATIMIADEPTAALDKASGDNVLAMLLDAAAENDAALLCASHDVALLERNGFRLSHIIKEDDGAGGFASRIAGAADADADA